MASVVDGSLPTTPDQRREVAEIELDLTRRRAQYDQICQPILDALADADVPYRLIKGSSLPWTAYPDPQLRPTGDLDLLVPGSRLAVAVEALEALGGEPVNPEPTAGYARHVFKGLTVAMPSGLEVDLHRVLSWGPLGVRVPEADLWAPGRRFDRLGRPAVTLDADRTLLHVSAHLLLLGAIRASEVRDVAQALLDTELDASRTLAIAHRWGHEAILASALLMAEREIGLSIRPHVLLDWASAHRVSRRDAFWLRVDRPDAPVRGVEPIGVLIELPGLRPRITMLRALIAPRPGTDPTFWHRLGGLARR